MIREDIVTEIDIFIKQKELEKEKIAMLNLDKDIANSFCKVAKSSGTKFIMIACVI